MRDRRFPEAAIRRVYPGDPDADIGRVAVRFTDDDGWYVAGALMEGNGGT